MTMADTNSPRPPIWRRNAFLSGAVVGLALGSYLEWYFNWGPAAGGSDSGEAHGFWLLLVGFPATWILIPILSLLPAVVGRILIVMGVGANWAVLGAALDALIRPRSVP
jgi:hypothetical protein